MDKDFLELITEVLLPERLGGALQKNERYIAAINEENRLFESLENSLDEEQKKMLMDYFDAACTTKACMEGAAYRQGMKDLLSLFRSLSVESEFGAAGQYPETREKQG